VSDNSSRDNQKASDEPSVVYKNVKAADHCYKDVEAIPQQQIVQTIVSHSVFAHVEKHLTNQKETGTVDTSGSEDREGKFSAVGTSSWSFIQTGSRNGGLADSAIDLNASRTVRSGNSLIGSTMSSLHAVKFKRIQ
jgi:hypothetical protein